MDTTEFSTDGKREALYPVIEVDSDNEKPIQTEIPFSFGMYDELIDICQGNIQYFERDNTETGKRFLDTFRSIIKQMAILRRYVTEFYGFSHEYDFDEHTLANGYRSIVKATHGCINHTTKICKHIAENRRSLLFRKMSHVKQIEACSQALASLCSVFEEANKIRGKCERGSLFSNGKSEAVDLFKISGAIDQYPFYGRCVGFHYCRSMQLVMKYLEIFIVGCGELYYNKSTNPIIKGASAFYHANKYLRKPELCAKRYLDLSLHAGVDFAKAFLSLTEKDLIHAPPNLLNAKIKVNRLITIPPEPLEIENTQNPNEMVQIPIPSSHLGVGPVTVRLLSNVCRTGMQFRRNNHHIHPMSNSLVFHCHGGGFIAHTSKSHEIYLRRWAAELQVPILSIDYSLAPQAPYPRALEEAFYAFCWAIKNAHLLGTTAERIIVVGDSAGGCLVMALMLKCIEQSVRRPDGALLIYCPLSIGFVPSPSRLLTMLDTLVAFGFLMKCVKAYIHQNDTENNDEKPESDANLTLNNKQNSSNDNKSQKKILNLSPERNLADDYRFDVPRDPYISPLYASDEILKQLPPIKFLSTDMDPVLDDCITMSRRLKALGNSVGLDVLAGLPHGFLNFIQLSKEAQEGSRICVSRMAELLGTTLDARK